MKKVICITKDKEFSNLRSIFGIDFFNVQPCNFQLQLYFISKKNADGNLVTAVGLYIYIIHVVS